MTWTRRDWIILLAVTLLAAGLRFYKLGSVPPGFQFDEAFNAIDAGHILDGNRPLFLPANAGREALYSYFQAGLAALFGLNIYTLRLASALAGIAAIPGTAWSGFVNPILLFLGVFFGILILGVVLDRAARNASAGRR